ncbi:MAG TPA: hypothetical protein VIY08_07770 [Candidatus Nitrosocosmicus sp.]
MNKGKIGEPFHYPNTFLLLLGYAVFKDDYIVFAIDCTGVKITKRPMDER